MPAAGAPDGQVGQGGPGEQRGQRDERLLRRFGELQPDRRREVLRICVEAARTSGARQVELVDDWIARFGGDLDRLPEPTAFGPHDARVFQGGPPRRLVPQGSSTWRRAGFDWAEAAAQRARDPFARGVSYQYASGRVVAVPGEVGGDVRLRNLLAGYLPGQDLAEALVRQFLDRGTPLQAEAEYFAHLYCDRSARAYEGVTLFDIWGHATGLIEMPDVDVRAFAIKVWNDHGLPVPLSARDQRTWYPRISDSFVRLRDYMEVHNGLATSLFHAEFPSRGGAHRVEMFHGVLAVLDEDPEALIQWLREAGDDFVARSRELLDREAGWELGRARQFDLRDSRLQIRTAVLEALEREGLTGPSP